MPNLNEFIHWPILALCVLAALGYHHFINNPLSPEPLHAYQFSFINFLLFLFVSALFFCYVTLFLRPPTEHRTSVALAVVAFLCLAVALGLIIWQDVDLLRPRPVNFHRSIGLKLTLTIFVFGVPALTFMHVALVDPQRYLSDLRFYREIYALEEPGYATAEPHARLRNLYNSLPALSLHFLRTQSVPPLPKWPQASITKRLAARRLVNKLNALSNSTFLSVLRFTLYLLVLYLPLRYAGLYVEVLKAQQAKEEGSLGLEEDVISKVSTFAAALLALIAALALSGFSFGEIGVFGGLVAAGVSVALRDVLANLMAGIILTWDRTISKDDVISLPSAASTDVGSTYGIVKAMTLRYTVVEERNTVSRLIPNSLLINETVENWTKSGDLVRLAVNVGVEYKADPKRVKAILESVCYEVERVSMEKRPQALITALNDSSVNYALRFWVKTPKLGIRPVLSAVYFHILERFGDENINIAFPQLDLHVDSSFTKKEQEVDLAIGKQRKKGSRRRGSDLEIK